MPRQSLSHIRTWVFDLDNTLYPPHMRLFDQIEEKMRSYLMRELGLDQGAADTLRSTYWQQYGTTLAGLIKEHNIDADSFLHEVHDISFDVLSPSPDLASAIDILPGRKIIYTNGSAPYAREVIKHRGLDGVFDAVYGFENAGYRPKPDAEAFAQVFGKDGFETSTAAMFEDEARNLIVPHKLGMGTIHVAPDPAPEQHIQHHTDDLEAFLQKLI